MLRCVTTPAISGPPASNAWVSRWCKTIAIVSSMYLIPAIGMASSDAGFIRYQCVVLGNSNACPADPRMPPAREVQRTVPGPYAHYLMYVGWSKADALAKARRLGECPQRQTVRVVHSELTSLQRYALAMGHPAPQERTEVVVSVSADGDCDPDNAIR